MNNAELKEKLTLAYELPPELREKLRKRALRFIKETSLIIDTETTGINADSEIIEITILSINGKVLFNTLIKPKNEIPLKATEIHGITNKMVENSPIFQDVCNIIQKIIVGKTLIGHNIEFDEKRLAYELGRCGIEGKIHKRSGCTMKMCMTEHKERWKNLAKAKKWLGLESNGTIHRSLQDAEDCRQVLLHLAKL